MRPEKGNYTRVVEIDEYTYLVTIEDYLESVDGGSFIDYDGHGYASKPVSVDDVGTVTFMEDVSVQIIPSEYDENIPLDATHINWFNR